VAAASLRNCRAGSEQAGRSRASARTGDADGPPS